jgi:hypothetical protein
VPNEVKTGGQDFLEAAGFRVTVAWAISAVSTSKPSAAEVVLLEAKGSVQNRLSR